MANQLKQKFKQVLQDQVKQVYGGVHHHAKLEAFPGYGGLVKPRLIQNVKVPNRGLLSSEGERDKKQKSPNQGGDETQRELINLSNKKKKNAQDQEEEDANYRAEIQENLEAEEEMLMEAF